MEKKKMILITEDGVEAVGSEPAEVIAMTINALVHEWNRDVCHIDMETAGKRVIDTLKSCETTCNLKEVFKMMMEDDA